MTKTKSFDAVLGEVAARFMSGNAIGVERAHVTSDEWSTILAELASLRGRVEPSAECAHADAEIHPLDPYGIVKWCKRCGAFEIDSKWQLPEIRSNS